MATLQDLEAAIAAIGQAVTQYGTEVTAVQTKINDLISKLSNSGIPDADVQALVNIGKAIGDANTKLQTAINTGSGATPANG